MLAIVFRDWLQTGPDGLESGSTTLRNLSLVVAALIALPLAIWRSKVAERQADAAHQSVRNERYQKGAEVLGSDVLTVRLGGIYALQRLAEEHPEQYHVQIMRLLCDSARHPIADEGSKTELRAGAQRRLRQDVQAAMTAISTCHAKESELERTAGFQLDLHDAQLADAYLAFANLSHADLSDANLSRARIWVGNLSHAKLWDAELSRARLFSANLSHADLWKADLSGATLWSANLSEAKLRAANLSGADLSGAKLGAANLSGAQLSTDDGESPATGLTQVQLDQAHADSDCPPVLDGLVDAQTGEPLVWRGKPLNGEA